MFFEPRSWKPSEKKHTDDVDDIYSVSNSETHTIFGKFHTTFLFIYLFRMH